MQSKEQIRREHRRRRRAMTSHELAAAAVSIAKYGTQWALELAPGPRSAFAVYLGVGSEPPTARLISAIHAAGHRVVLPVCEPERHLSWVYWTPATRFARSRFAPIDEPEGQRMPHLPSDVSGVFLPATAVDLAGSRVGQGGGYYDRLLASLDALGQRPPTAAVVYDEEVLPSGAIPAEPFDRPVPTALTPSGLIQLSPGIHA